jgi:hypothetical protein
LRRACPYRGNRISPPHQGGEGPLLAPKIVTGKRLTCGPSLVGDLHSARGFPQSIR